MFQKERLGGYLVDGSRYIGFKIQLLRPYTFRRYSLYKIGFWNHPELSHCGIFAIKKKSVTFQTLNSEGYLQKLVRYLW
jgi:hypothetical protein